MKTISCVLLAVVAGASFPSAVAQGTDSAVVALGGNRVSMFLRKTLAQRGKELVEAAAEMPAEKYGFKAPPDDVTFGYLTLHIADGNYLYCSFIGGVPAPTLSQLTESDPKKALIERIKSSFDFCATAVANLDDSHMSDLLTIGETKTSRSMAVLTLASSWATHYELQQKYLALNGYSSPTASK